MTFLQQDLFKSDLTDATVVTLYLSNSVNMRLRGLLQRQLKPGSRIVSHRFDMADWVPDQIIQVKGAYVYFWTIAPKGR